MTESSPIEAVIFDADGVLQRPTVRWRPALKSALRLEEPELDGFLAELMAVEAAIWRMRMTSPTRSGRCWPRLGEPMDWRR